MSVPLTDAIILAGGNGSRLKGIAATGMKPLLVVNGEALITRLVRQARKHAGGNTIVVTSPSNTQAICDLVDSPSVQFVVQPEPRGPGDALYRGSEACVSNRMLVLMGDNLMEDEDVDKVAYNESETVIGTGVMTANAERFTTVRRCYDPTVHSEYLESAEGDYGPAMDSPWMVWCGPLILPRQLTRQVLWEHRSDGHHGEMKIGRYLGEIARPDEFDFELVKARDIGIPEAL